MADKLPDRVLSSWKEIASFLGVGVRTAQMWEQQRGLPVRRLPGPRGRVLATVGELESWRSSCSYKHPVSAPTRLFWPALAVAGVLLALGAVVGGRRIHPATEFAVQPLTSSLAAERFPDIHPAGGLVIYLVDDPQGPVLRQQDIGSDTATVLASGVLGFPRWSRDGSTITYARQGPAAVHLVARDRNGGERVITQLNGPDRAENHLSALMTDTLPDNNLVIADRPEPGRPYALVIVDRLGNRRTLAAPLDRSEGDFQPAASPDARWIAFVRQYTFSEADLFLMPTSGNGEPRRLTFDHAKIAGLTWLNNDELVISSNRSTGKSSLWRLNRNGGSPTLVTGAAGVANFPRAALTEKGALLVYQYQSKDNNIWRATAEKTAPLVQSTWPDFNPAFNTAGDRIAFISKRSGHNEVWTAKADGTEPRQMTRLETGFTDSPRWSPDGAWIAFTSVSAKNRDIYVVSSEGGPVQRITQWESEEGRASWSLDGRALYFRSDRSGRPEIWKVRFPEPGTPVKITSTGAFEAFPSGDGSLWFVAGRDRAGLWRLRGDRPPELAVSGVREGRWWVTRTGIVYQDYPNRAIKRYDFASQRTAKMFDLPGRAPIEAGLSSHPSESAVLYTQTDEDTADILLARLPR